VALKKSKHFNIRENYNFEPLFLDKSHLNLRRASYRNHGFMQALKLTAGSKDEMNKDFANKYPKIHYKITMSKIIRLKDDLVKIFLKEKKDKNT
jgi:hypothetical protein